MNSLILGAIVVFSLALIGVGSAQRAQFLRRQKQRQMRQYRSNINHYQHFLETIPNNYLGKELSLFLIYKTINSLESILALGLDDEEEQAALRNALTQQHEYAETLSQGKMPRRTRVSSHAEAQQLKHTAQGLSQVFKKKHQGQQLSGDILRNYQEQLQCTIVLAEIDAEVATGDDAKQHQDLDAALRHYNTALNMRHHAPLSTYRSEALHDLSEYIKQRISSLPQAQPQNSDDSISPEEQQP